MAAGLGTRLQPYTQFLPKPLLPLMGVPMIQFALDQVAEAGVKEVVINFHYLPEVAKKSLLALDHHQMKVHLSDEASPSIRIINNKALELPIPNYG